MKKTFKLFPLLLCLLYSIAQASPPSQKDFEFLEPFNDTTLVENGLALTGSIAGVSLSTLLNQGIWWGVCEIEGMTFGLSKQYNLAGPEKQELENLKTDFCLELASMVAITEVALAGHVSPWPLEKRWWKPLYFAGTAMAGYAAYADPTKRKFIPVAVLGYLAMEAGSRTGASASSTLILRKMNVRDRDIETVGYVAGEYVILSTVNGVLAWAVVYEAMIHKGFRPAKAALAAVVSAAIAGTLSGIISESTIDMDGQTKAESITRTVVGTVVGTVAGSGAVALVGAGTVAGTVAGSGAIVLAGCLAGAGAGSVAGSLAGSVAVAGAGSVAVGLSTWSSSKMASNNPLIKVGVTLVPALTFAVLNSLSNYAVYGYPLEEGLSETAWTQWKKFYAPLEYLSTLFN